jgi:hypothetical protein
MFTLTQNKLYINCKKNQYKTSVIITHWNFITIDTILSYHYLGFFLPAIT